MNVKELRKITKLSQGKFAKQYFIPTHTLQNWEAGRREPPEYVLKLLERVVKEDYQ